MSFNDWFESKIETYCGRRLSGKDIARISYNAGLERAAEVVHECKWLSRDNIAKAIRAEIDK